MKERIIHALHSLDARHPTSMRLLRYLIAGGLSTVTNLACFFVLIHTLHVWYVTSSVIAFLISFGISFVCQKYWTFKNKTTGSATTRQGLAYFGVSIINLLLNTALIYSFTEYGRLYPLVSSILASAIIAFESYFVYRFFIFKVQDHS